MRSPSMHSCLGRTYRITACNPRAFCPRGIASTTHGDRHENQLSPPTPPPPSKNFPPNQDTSVEVIKSLPGGIWESFGESGWGPDGQHAFMEFDYGGAAWGTGVGGAQESSAQQQEGTWSSGVDSISFSDATRTLRSLLLPA